MRGEAGEELDTPAARIMARRASRATMPDRLKVAAPDDSSDEEWNGDDDEDEEEDGRVYLDALKCGRVRLHAVQGAAQSSSGLGRTAQEPGRQGLGTPHGGGEQRGCQRCGELRVGERGSEEKGLPEDFL